MGFIKDPDVNCFFLDGRYSFRALDYDYSSGNIYFSEVKYRVRSIRVAHMKNITDNMAIIQGTGYVYGKLTVWGEGGIQDQVWYYLLLDRGMCRLKSEVYVWVRLCIFIR